jgi:hypothetical protein
MELTYMKPQMLREIRLPSKIYREILDIYWRARY